MLVIALIAAFAAAKAVLFDTLDPDCFWHLRVADQLLHDGIGPLVDHLSFASSRQPWTPYSWLAELGMRWIWNLGGYRLAVAVQAMLQAAIVLTMAAACLEFQAPAPSRGTPEEGWGESDFACHKSFYARNHPHPSPLPEYRARGPESPRYLAAVLATAAGTFLSLPYLSFRPVTAALLLLWVITFLVLRDRSHGQRTRAVWLVLPLTALLTNIHLFSFLVPAVLFVLTVSAVLEQSPGWRRYAVLTAGATLAFAATPMLPGLLRTAFFYGSQDTMVAGPAIAEMQSFARGPMGFVSAILVAGAITCCVLHRDRLRLGDQLCLAVGTLLLLKLGRFAPVFAMAAIPPLAATLPRLSDRALARPPVWATLSVVLLMALGRIVAAFPRADVPLSAWLNRLGPAAPGYPTASADFIDRHVDRSTGRLINEFSWGGYLTWRLGDRYQVLLDGRTQVYPAAVWQATTLGTDAQLRQYLRTVHADAALVGKDHDRFELALDRLGWVTVHEDDRARVMIPGPPATARIE